MKYKIVCEVTFPAYEISIDVNVPINKSIYYLCNMLDRIIIEQIDPNYKADDNHILVNKTNGIVLDKNILVKLSSVKSGLKLTYL